MPKAITFVLLLTVVVAGRTSPAAGRTRPGGVVLRALLRPGGHAGGRRRAERRVPRPISARQVRADIDRIMADIKAAEKRGDVVDGVPVGQSSNPYDYVGISPAFTKLVALGKPALPAIAAEIEASDQNGLREYLLAAAGAQIDGDTPGSGAQTWSTGKEWARQYREDD